MSSNEFYQQILGLVAPWKIVSVDLNMEERKVTVEVEVDHKVKWGDPATGEAATLHKWTVRTWRHLDTCQFVTHIRARVPSVRHGDGRIEEVQVPWADRFQRMTRMMEQAVIMWLGVCGNVGKVAATLGLGWHTVNAIMQRAVERGMLRRTAEVMPYIGLDEKAFRKGHVYATVLNDLEGARVIDMVEGRKEKDTVALLERLTEEQKSGVEGVAMDMWQAFENGAAAVLAGADVVFDRYHVSGHLNKGVDAVRRAENRKLMAAGDRRLAGTKYGWLKTIDDLRTEPGFQELYRANLETSRAWRLKDAFYGFWNYRSAAAARKFLEAWCEQVRTSGLAPMIRVMNMIEKRKEGLLNYMKHGISNAMSEGLNSLIARISANARGLGGFAALRVRVLFFLGKLDLSLS